MCCGCMKMLSKEKPRVGGIDAGRVRAIPAFAAARHGRGCGRRGRVCPLGLVMSMRISGRWGAWIGDAV